MDPTCAETIDVATAGVCATADVKNVDLVKEEADKTSKEVELFHEIKTYIIELNGEATNELAKLYVIASAYECNLDDFVIVIYAAKRWKNFLLDGLCKYIEEKSQEKIGDFTIPCEFKAFEVIPGLLYSYHYYICSFYTQHEKLKMFYHNVE